MKKLAILLLILLYVQASRAQDKPRIAEADRIRLAEAFRLGEALGNRIWPDWSKAPFAVLLVTPEREFLKRSFSSTNIFRESARSGVLRSCNETEQRPVLDEDRASAPGSFR